MVYYFCHCMSLHASPGECFILDSRLATFLRERNCAFCLSACSCLIVMPLQSFLTLILSASFFPFGVLDGRY